MDELTMGARIAHRRREKNMTQEALAQVLGVSNQAVSKWEGDACCPDIQLLPALCDALGMTLDALFGREAPQPAELSVNEGLPWPDDEDLHAVLFQGHRLLLPHEGSLFRHDQYNAVRKTVELHFSGTAQNIYSDFSVICSDTTISGDIRAHDSVQCSDVGGSVSAGDGVTCGSIGGNAQAGDGLTCSGDIHGSVRAGDSVNGGNIVGDVQAGDSVQCGNVTGSVRAGDRVECGDVGGSVQAERVQCKSAGGILTR